MTLQQRFCTTWRLVFSHWDLLTLLTLIFYPLSGKFFCPTHHLRPPLITSISRVVNKLSLWCKSMVSAKENRDFKTLLSWGPFLKSLGNFSGDEYMPETSCMKDTSVHFKKMWIKQLCNHEFEISLSLSKCENLLGAFEKQASGHCSFKIVFALQECRDSIKS